MPLRQSAIEFEVDGEPVSGIMAGPVAPAKRIPGVVLCHPHPLFGGSMESPVVFAICRELAELGIASLRFNFRRPKDGSAAVTESAIHDLVTAFEIIREWDHVNPKKCGLTGHSFGAAAILKSWRFLDDARAISLVAPPLNAMRDTAIGDDRRRRQIVIGQADKLVHVSDVRDSVAVMKRPTELVEIPEADHFFWHREPEVARTVAQFFKETLA
ncbi:MAG: hypothetical protein HY682_00980 [Chloroflexi bacterium]|nr:hypothetical protein [Chloroflexota bacterium]